MRLPKIGDKIIWTPQLPVGNGNRYTVTSIDPPKLKDDRGRDWTVDFCWGGSWEEIVENGCVEFVEDQFLTFARELLEKGR